MNRFLRPRLRPSSAGRPLALTVALLWAVQPPLPAEPPAAPATVRG